MGIQVVYQFFCFCSADCARYKCQYCKFMFRFCLKVQVQCGMLGEIEIKFYQFKSKLSDVKTLKGIIPSVLKVSSDCFTLQSIRTRFERLVVDYHKLENIK